MNRNNSSNNVVLCGRLWRLMNFFNKRNTVVVCENLCPLVFQNKEEEKTHQGIKIYE